eukprot:TRINITY_DN3859_c0_g1_i1.p1 TRINITY_DN3859_c0_g1~~TRINITY_DN3859_c0_g1_i1.p1  ORF type:complete len:57 (-),score=6.16 TRINITY_DN3859_c0_g1_i1:141-311(-)
MAFDRIVTIVIVTSKGEKLNISFNNFFSSHIHAPHGHPKISGVGFTMDGGGFTVID